jgi:hypothetical protein
MRRLTCLLFLALAVASCSGGGSGPSDGGGGGGSGGSGGSGGHGGSSGDKPCRYAGKAYAVGDTYPDVDLCNTCSCTAIGSTTCTTRVCLPDAGANDATTNDAATNDAATNDADAGGACVVTDTYHFGATGGLVAFQDESVLSPPAHYVRTRTTFRGGDGPTMMECAPALPTCGSNDVISLLDITRDLAHPDVVAAFAKTTAPVYGIDPRPVDGTIFSVSRGDGRSLLVGSDCGAGQTGCVAVPHGVRVLADQLSALASQMLATPECAAFR